MNNQFNNIELYFNLEDIDLVVKFLYVKAKVENINYDLYKDLYTKSILRYFGWVNDGKTKISEFISSFDAVIESIQKKWFDSQYPVVLSKDNMILNGRHRIAVCKYFNIDPTYEINEDYGHRRYEMNLDFYSSIYSEYEIETLLLEYLNNFKDENYFVTFFWWDSEEKWDFMKQKFIEEWCKISYEKLFVFKEENYFENILEWIYTFENGIKQNGNIFIKTEGLKKNMKFRLTVLKYEWEKTYRSVRDWFPICREFEKIKFQIREELSDNSAKNFSFLHASDDYSHTRYLLNFMLNPNISYLRKISRHNIFMNRTNKFLFAFQDLLQKNNLERYDFCIESWIILQIFWIRKAADLDFICREKYRDKIKFFPKDVDLHSKNRYLKISKLTDNEVIADRKNFFFYKWYKFISPTLLIKNSQHLSKKKNLDMQELKKYIEKKWSYKLNIIYKTKVFLLLKYYWMRRRIINVITFIFTKKQKYYIKKFLNKYFGQNYSLDYD